MNAKTNNFSIREWIVSIVIALILFFGVSVLLNTHTNVTNGTTIVAPWHTALVSSVITAINEFGTGFSEEVFQSQKIIMMISLFIFFIAAPVLLMRIMRKTDEEQPAGPFDMNWVKITGVSLVLMILISAFFSLYNNLHIHNYSKEQSERSRLVDQVRLEMMEITLEIASRSLAGDITSFETMRRDDISRMQRADRAEYHLVAESDTLLNLIAVIPLKGSSADFENANGETGYVQIKTVISPGNTGVPVTQNRL
jgi:hypothetical protein